ncbi:MAG: hypothetical protein J6A70_05085 [Prevotella sp.]|nr:hypothetical protein [Prevotella sp.]
MKKEYIKPATKEINVLYAGCLMESSGHNWTPDGEGTPEGGNEEDADDGGSLSKGETIWGDTSWDDFED